MTRYKAFCVPCKVSYCPNITQNWNGFCDEHKSEPNKRRRENAIMKQINAELKRERLERERLANTKAKE